MLLYPTYLNDVYHNIKEIRFAQGLHLILTKLHLHHHYSFIINNIMERRRRKGENLSVQGMGPE
jgi:hypothetical protein